MCPCRGDGAAAAACVLRSGVVAERARRGGRVCVATTARRVCCVRLATAALRSSSGVAERARRGGRVPAMLVVDAARRTLTNCLKGCTITALTSDILLRYLVAAGSLSLSVSLRQLHHQRSYGVGRTAIRCTAIVAC